MLCLLSAEESGEGHLKTFIIVNPASSGGATEKNWAALEVSLRDALGPYNWAFTEKIGHGTELAREAILNGYSRIVAVGGDGTVNEVINGFFDGDKALSSDVHLAMIDAGTGGDFRKNIGLPCDQEDQIAAIKAGKIKDVTLGLAKFVNAEGRPQLRYFGVISSFGISGEVNQYVNESPHLKRYGSSAAFAFAALKTLFTYKNAPVKITIDSDTVYEGPALLGVACNGPWTGGGMLMAPSADSFSPDLDYVVAGDLNLFERLMVFPRIYNGTHLKRKKIYHQKGKKLGVVSLQGDQIVTDMDGDLVGYLPLEIEVCPAAIKVIVS